MEYRKIKFPMDELHHDNIIEWWYFNGFLDTKKNKYAFMTCLFKADRKKVNLKFLKIPVKNIFFSHSLLYDLKKKTVQR
jgi:predicted secreted hydrolase